MSRIRESDDAFLDVANELHDALADFMEEHSLREAEMMALLGYLCARILAQAPALVRNTWTDQVKSDIMARMGKPS